MQLRPATSHDFAAMAAMAAPLQREPRTHVLYLGMDPATIEAELDGLDCEPWSCVAVDDDRIIGWVVGDVDPEMGRVWWHGPFVAEGGADVVASAMLDTCRRSLAASITQEELAFDARAEALGRWATTQGFVSEPGSVVLTLDEAGIDRLAPPTRVVRPIGPDDTAAVAAMHDDLFPDTHTTGAALVASADPTHPRLVVDHGGGVAGYVAVEQDEDGSGYVDFLGVDPAQRRGGLGAELVRAAVQALAAIDARPVHLTVREANAGARELYASLGFVEERIAHPYRLGFTLP